MTELRHNPHHVDLPGAARHLELDEDAVRALVAVGYLRPAEEREGPFFALADLKAFIARNADNGSGNITNLLDTDDVNPQTLLDALDSCLDVPGDGLVRSLAGMWRSLARKRDQDTRRWSLSSLRIEPFSERGAASGRN